MADVKLILQMKKLKEQIIGISKGLSNWLKQANGVWSWIAVTAAVLLLSYYFPEWLFSRSGLDRIKWAGLLFTIGRPLCCHLWLG
jgi:hypothetical protein